MIKHLTALLLAITLTGCASWLPQGGRDEQQRNLSQQLHWQVHGKLSVTTPDDSVTGYLDWQQNDQAFDLFIAGPFGQGASHLQGDEHRASLLLPGWDKPQYAKSAEQLMQRHVGWKFPVTDIRYWVKGQPSPASASKAEFDDNGLLKTLSQHGWSVTYSRYSPQGSAWVPGLIKVSGYDFRFVFVIKKWTLYD